VRGLLFESLLQLAFLSLPLLVIAWSARGPVSRPRVQRFAARYDLTITEANGEHVIRYLATTRRWRAAGLAAGYLMSVLPSLTMPRVTVNFLALFAGWFAGALIAEIRIEHLSRGARSAASLVARQLSGYVAPAARAAVPVAVGFAVALTVIALVVGQADAADVELWQVAAWLSMSLLVAALVRQVQQRVLLRPQPQVAPDVLVADDAIRSRSLHVMAGAGATLVTYCAMGQLLGFDAGAEQLAQRIGLVVTPAAAVLGWWVSRLQSPGRRSKPERATPVPVPGGGS
jgi:hypothetical protein